MTLPVRSPWYSRTVVDSAITMLTEPHVHPLLRCNIWHVRGRDHDLVIDTGLGVHSLVDAAPDLFAQDTLAVATHAHTDHIGNFHEFDRRAIHHLEADVAACISGTLELSVSNSDEDTLDELAGWGYDIRGGLLTALPTPDFPLDGHPRHAAEPTVLLADGDVIDLGDRALEVLHLPGHSPGSIALWDRTSKILFSGDVIYDGPLLDEIPGSDREQYRATMQRLQRLDVDIVHAASMTPHRFRELIDAYFAT